MRIIVIICLSFVFAYPALLAQTDANFHQIELGTEDNQEKVNIYNDMARHFRDRDPELTFFYSNTAVEIADKIDYVEGTADAYRNNGYAYIHIGESEEGLEWYMKAQAIYDSLGLQDKLAASFIDVGVVKRKMGDYKTAHQQFSKALETSKNTKSLALLSRIHNNIGYLLKIEAKYAEALEHLLVSLEYAQRIGDQKTIASRLSNIGEIYDIHIADYEKAAEYHQEALGIREDIQDLRGICISYRNLGAMERRRQNYDVAMTYLEDAKLLADSIQYKTLIASSEFHTAYLLNEQQEYELALPHIKNAINIQEEGKNYRGHVFSLILAGEINQSLKEYDTAFRYGKRAFQLAEDANMSEARGNAAFLLAQCYGVRNNYEKAYKHYIIHQEMDEDRKNNLDVIKTATLKQARLYEQKEAARKERQRLYVMGGIFVLFLLALLLSYRRNQSRKKFNKELIKKNQELQLAREKAEEAALVKQNFIATMSHEIRTPMNAVIGFADLLLDEQPKPSQVSYLKDLRASGKQLMSILDDLLDFSKIEAQKFHLEKEGFDARNLIMKIGHAYKNIGRKKAIEVEVNFRESSLKHYLIGDPIRLNQILSNLLDNAVKFTEKGYVKVEAWTEQINKREVKLFVSVADTGIGISESNKAKVFESFTQDDVASTRKYGGTGLGLAICKRLVELQGGEIEVESKLGKGSIFSFFIPYQTASKIDFLKASKEIVNTLDVTKLQGKKALVVEDNPLNQKILVTILKKWGIQVAIATNGEDAIYAVDEGDFDIVMMDLFMPNMNGFEASKRIRSLSSESAKVPIVAITASNLNEITDEAREAGIYYQIGKPFKINDLHAIVCAALNLSTVEVLNIT
ncbi:MAG: ATP-binding protein [Bacteroidota bacterium]